MPSGSATTAANGEMPIELFGGQMRVVERRAGEFELSARLERDGAAAVRVIEADEIAVVLDPVPAERLLHALEQRPNASVAAIRHRRTIRAVEWYFLVFRADSEWTARLATRLKPRDQRVARLDNLTIDDVASHSGAHPTGRRTGDPAR